MKYKIIDDFNNYYNLEIGDIINLIKNTQTVFKQDKKIYKTNNYEFSNEMYNLIPKYVKKYGCKDRTPGEIVMMIIEDHS